MFNAARKLKSEMKQNPFVSRIGDLKNKTEERYEAAKTKANDKLLMAKTRVRQVQNQSLSRVVDAQIKTDSWIRSTAEKFEHPKTAPVKSTLIAFSDKWMDIGIEDYDALNAKDASKAVKVLGLSDLLRVEAHEKSRKNRKTVLSSITARLEKFAAGEV